MTPVIMIHGGFFSEATGTAEMKLAKQQALSDIVDKAYKYLLSNDALKSAAYAVSMLEDCDLFNAGLGSQIQADGKIRLSASLMNGANLKFSGVINIQHVKNPVLIAEKLMDFDDRVLSGAEAQVFSRRHGFEYFDPETEIRRQEYFTKLKGSVRIGTVGCVALDGNGKLAAATSTGGKGFEIPGRVSDSATVAGNFADMHAAISCTGVGEDIVSTALAAKVAARVADGFNLREAAEKSFAELKGIEGFAGFIAISASGDTFHGDSHPYMVWAKHDGRLQVFD